MRFLFSESGNSEVTASGLQVHNLAGVNILPPNSPALSGDLPVLSRNFPIGSRGGRAGGKRAPGGKGVGLRGPDRGGGAQLGDPE